MGLRRTRAVSVRSCALSVATRPPEVLAVEGAVGRPRRGVHAALRRIATPGPDPAEERLPDGVRVRVEVVDLGGGGRPRGSTPADSLVEAGGIAREGVGLGSEGIDGCQKLLTQPDAVSPHVSVGETCPDRQDSTKQGLR